MKKCTVWRVENQYGNGPYNCEYANIALLLTHVYQNKAYLKDRWPLPWQDKILKSVFNSRAVRPHSTSLFGFKDIKQYKNWFAGQEVQDLLHNTGFFLAKYKALSSDIKILYGQAQVMFFRKDFMLVGYRACNAGGIHDKPFHKASRRHQKKYGFNILNNDHGLTHGYTDTNRSFFLVRRSRTRRLV